MLTDKDTRNPFEIRLMNLGHCPLCREHQRQKLFAIKGSSVFQCSVCGLRYIDPCLSPDSMKTAYESEKHLSSFHGFHEGYYEYGNLTGESKTLTDFKHALELLERFLPKEGSRTIFDVGFGNGFFLAVAKQRGWQVHGNDSSLKNTELAHQKFGLTLSCSSFEDYENQGARYDALSFWDVIEHLPDPHKFLKKTHEMLKPGGFLLIGIPNDRSMLSAISSLLYRTSFGRLRKGIDSTYFLEHVCYYNLKTISDLLSRNGFVLRDYFFTSTDLDKYSFSAFEKILAHSILLLGKLCGLQNRLVAIFQKG